MKLRNELREVLELTLMRNIIEKLLQKNIPTRYSLL